MLINGEWQQKWDPYQKVSDNGGFVRKASSFRHWITPDGAAGKTGDAGFKAEAGRYHLYVALICPWACRTLMVRKLKGLENVVSFSVVEPTLGDQGWRFADEKIAFPGAQPDPFNGARYVHELYSLADATYSGKATVPVLWDKQQQTIVNNESADIIAMLNDSFNAFAETQYNLRPQSLLTEMQELNDDIYHRINNGVYRAAFAKTQEAYDEAFDDVFAGLADMEARLAGQSFLFGENITEADVRLFVTLVRFDIAYYGLFKTNQYKISDYANLSRYLKRIYAIPGIAETVNLDHIKAGYYSIKALNPMGIVPKGPTLDFV